MKTRFLFFFALCLGMTGCIGQDNPTPARDASLQVDADSSAAATTSGVNTVLEGKRWAVRTLNGKAVEVYANQPEPNVVFAAEAGQGRVSGSDGCNLLVGSYAAGASSIEFQHIGTTMMLCPQGADQSRAFLKALGETTAWKLDGTKLELLNGDKTLVVFEGVVL